MCWGLLPLVILGRWKGTISCPCYLADVLGVAHLILTCARVAKHEVWYLNGKPQPPQRIYILMYSVQTVQGSRKGLKCRMTMWLETLIQCSVNSDDQWKRGSLIVLSGAHSPAARLLCILKGSGLAVPCVSMHTTSVCDNDRLILSFWSWLWQRTGFQHCVWHHLMTVLPHFSNVWLAWWWIRDFFISSRLTSHAFSGVWRLLFMGISMCSVVFLIFFFFPPSYCSNHVLHSFSFNYKQ